MIDAEQLAVQAGSFRLDGLSFSVPAGAYAVLLDGDWVYFAGTYHYTRYQDWVLERRWIADGYAHIENPGEPPR